MMMRGEYEAMSTGATGFHANFSYLHSQLRLGLMRRH
jgi:hypothetical protein